MKRAKRQRRRISNFGMMTSVILIIVVLALLNKVNFRPEAAIRQITNDKNGSLMLVNKKHKIGKNFVPENLQNFTVRTGKSACEEERHVCAEIMPSLEELFKAADKDGITLYALSGYRSYISQQNLYNFYLARDGKSAKDTVSLPGESEHQTGLALDITNSRRNFNGSREASWIADNCYKYGFIVRYPKGKEDITGYGYESWHIRYVGDDAAKEIHDKKITLEEYLNEV